jgi:hypothetical protein
LRNLRSLSIAAASATVVALLLLWEAPAMAAGVSPGQATPVQREQAQARFLKGRDKLGKKDFEGALAEFNASLDIVASPNARLYVGRCLRELGRIVPAYVELGRTEVEAHEHMREDPRYEKAAQAAHEERVKLEPQLAFVNVEISHAEPETKLTVNGDEIRRGGWAEPIPVLPGKTDIVVQTPGQAPLQKTISLQVTERKVVTVDMNDAVAPPPAPKVEKSPSDHASDSGATMRNIAWVAGGAAVVGLGMFVVFGLKSSSTYGDLDTACNAGPCPPGHEGDISAGRTEQTVANIGLVVALAGAAASATLFVLAPSGSPKRSARARVDVGPSFVGLRGAF